MPANEIVKINSKQTKITVEGPDGGRYKAIPRDTASCASCAFIVKTCPTQPGNVPRPCSPGTRLDKQNVIWKKRKDKQKESAE